MQKVNRHFYSFICGMADAMSLHWIRKILLVTNPTTKKIHPSSFELLSTLKNTLIQVFVFLIGLPFIFRYFQYQFIAKILSTFFLILTFGYLFFYNTDVMNATKKVALWSTKFPNSNLCEFDKREKAELFYSLSNQMKSFIFLVLYYTPIFITCNIIISYMPTIGTILLLISQSFFNSIFYFLKKWPYDRYNIAFIEKNTAYMLGFGFFVSFICNVCLTGDLSKGAYFIISQWMIINSLLHSPPDREFFSFQDVWQTVTSAEKRAKLGNGYNIHRKNIRSETKYRAYLLNKIVLLKPALKITEYLNNLLAKKMGESINFQTPITNLNEDKSVSDQISTNQTEVRKSFQQNRQKTLEVVSQTYEPEQ